MASDDRGRDRQFTKSLVSQAGGRDADDLAARIGGDGGDAMDSDTGTQSRSKSTDTRRDLRDVDRKRRLKKLKARSADRKKQLKKRAKQLKRKRRRKRAKSVASSIAGALDKAAETFETESNEAAADSPLFGDGGRKEMQDLGPGEGGDTDRVDLGLGAGGRDAGGEFGLGEMDGGGMDFGVGGRSDEDEPIGRYF